jgi:glycosyltransferase involved in cell wall biosynthesis
VRVLHIDTGTSWRGGQQQVLWLMEALRARGFEQLLLASERSPLASRIRNSGLPVAELSSPAMSLSNVQTVRKTRTAFELVHAHDSHAHSLAALAATAAPWRPLVVSRRVAFPIGTLGSFKYQAADAYIAVSDFVRHRLLDSRVSGSKIRVIFDGVPPPDPGSLLPTSASRLSFRSRHGADNQTIVFGTLTSLAPEKLLESELDLLTALPDSVHFWMAIPSASGSDSDIARSASLREYARSRGVAARFRILAVEENAAPFLAALDIFVYFSKLEGLGSAILLAMAHALPVLVSPVGGIPEIVRHQETGLLAGIESGVGITQPAMQLVQSKELRERLGSAGRKFVLANATCDRMAAQTVAIYEELLREKRLSQPLASVGRRANPD